MSLRDVAAVLHAVGDPEWAARWAQAAVTLDDGVAVGLPADSALALPDGITVFEGQTVRADAPIHAVLRPTPWSAALPASLREALPADPGLPAAVVLVERDTLDELSDDPGAEAEEIRSRVEGLVPSGWDVVDESDLPTWLSPHISEEGTRVRRASLALHLIDGAVSRRAKRLAEIVAERSAIAERLSELDAAVRSDAARGEAVAAGIRAAALSAGEALQTELDDFFDALRDALPREFASLDDWRRLDDHAGPWLQQVIEHGVRDALDRWRTRLLTEVGPLLHEDERKNTLPPSGPSPQVETLHGAAWRDRLPIALGLGGGAALLAVGQLLPGTLAVGASLTWRSLSHERRVGARRGKLLDQARSAVDLARLETISAVRERREVLLATLDGLPAARARSLRERQDEERRTLVQQQEQLERTRQRLHQETRALAEAREGWAGVA